MILTVPNDTTRFPTLGPQVVDWMHAHLTYGPGDLRGEPLELDAEQQAFIWRFYELFPKGHPLAGRRRFRRCALSLAKGLRKTELGAFVAIAELHKDAPVRFNGWRGRSAEPAPGRGVTDPFIVLMAYSEEQSDELAFAAMRAILAESDIGDDFDLGLERIIRKTGDGKAVSLAGSPNARDGARTTFQLFDETHRMTLDRLAIVRGHQPSCLSRTRRWKLLVGDDVTLPLRVSGELVRRRHWRMRFAPALTGGIGRRCWRARCRRTRSCRLWRSTDLRWPLWSCRGVHRPEVARLVLSASVAHRPAAGPAVARGLAHPGRVLSGHRFVALRAWPTRAGSFRAAGLRRSWTWPTRAGSFRATGLW